MTKNDSTKQSENLVLVVDDGEDACLAISDQLASENITCVTAHSVQEAVAALNTKPIALAIVDFGLRGSQQPARTGGATEIALDASGLKVVHACKEKNPLMPVIVMSGQPVDWRTDAALARATGFLAKPFTQTLLLEHVRQWLEFLRQTPKILLPAKEEDVFLLEEVKSTYIRHVYELLDKNISRTAEKLGIHRQTVSKCISTHDPAETAVGDTDGAVTRGNGG
jgi:DNA-binding NtrC family response regulator